MPIGSGQLAKVALNHITQALMLSNTTNLSRASHYPVTFLPLLALVFVLHLVHSHEVIASVLLALSVHKKLVSFQHFSASSSLTLRLDQSQLCDCQHP